jgi:hypothetical protein
MFLSIPSGGAASEVAFSCAGGEEDNSVVPNVNEPHYRRIEQETGPENQEIILKI